MPRLEPPAYVKMPGRPKIERRRKVGEQPKGTKLSRIKMRCKLCGKDYHNARRCPRNPKAGNKANAHIKRAKAKKRGRLKAIQLVVLHPVREAKLVMHR
jgi:hypothetical protein